MKEQMERAFGPRDRHTPSSPRPLGWAGMNRAFGPETACRRPPPPTLGGQNHGWSFCWVSRMIWLSEDAMIRQRIIENSAAEYLPAGRDIATLRRAAMSCRGCELYRVARQTVFGEGPS